MEEFGIAIIGIDETISMLDDAPKNIVKGAFAKAGTAAAVPVVKALKIPVHTGELAASLVTDVAVDDGGRGVSVQIGFGKEGYKANLVEYGHREIGHEPAKTDKGKEVPQEPFMRPAAADAAEASIDSFAETLRATLAENSIPNLRSAG